MLQDPDYLAVVAESPADVFWVPAYRTLRDAAVSVMQRGLPVDAISVAAEANQMGLAEPEEYLSHLPVGHAGYLPLLQERWLGRQAQNIGRALLQTKLRPDDALAHAVEAAQRVLGGGTSAKNVHDVSTLVQSALQGVQAGAPRWIQSGIPDLDAVLRFIGPGEVVVIGARPSQGKTALGLNIARTLAQSASTGVVFASWEMSPSALALRLLAQATPVNYGALADNQCGAGMWHKVQAAAQQMQTS